MVGQCVIICRDAQLFKPFAALTTRIADGIPIIKSPGVFMRKQQMGRMRKHQMGQFSPTVSASQSPRPLHFPSNDLRSLSRCCTFQRVKEHTMPTIQITSVPITQITHNLIETIFVVIILMSTMAHIVCKHERICTINLFEMFVWKPMKTHEMDTQMDWNVAHLQH